jgi:hypothetical protein
MRVDGEERSHILLPFWERAALDEENPAREEAGSQERKLAEEDAGADMPEEQAGCGLGRESSHLSQSISVDWFVHLSPTSLFTYSVRQFLSLPGPILVSHSSCTCLSMDSKSA